MFSVGYFSRFKNVPKEFNFIATSLKSEFNNCVWRPLPQSLILLLAAFEDSKTRMKYFSYSVLGIILSTLNYLTEIEIKLFYSISNVTLKPNESGLWCALLMRSTFSLWNGSEPVLLKYWILPIRCLPWEIGRRCIALSDFILLRSLWCVLLIRRTLYFYTTKTTQSYLKMLVRDLKPNFFY